MPKVIRIRASKAVRAALEVLYELRSKFCHWQNPCLTNLFFAFLEKLTGRGQSDCENDVMAKCPRGCSREVGVRTDSRPSSRAAGKLRRLAEGKQMERLGNCMDGLRVLARSNDRDRAVIVERHIDADLTTETVSVWQALERLSKGIRDEQAEGREGENWSIAKGYIRSVLHELA